MFDIVRSPINARRKVPGITKQSIVGEKERLLIHRADPTTVTVPRKGSSEAIVHDLHVKMTPAGANFFTDGVEAKTFHIMQHNYENKLTSIKVTARSAK